MLPRYPTPGDRSVRHATPALRRLRSPGATRSSDAWLLTGPIRLTALISEPSPPIMGVNARDSEDRAKSLFIHAGPSHMPQTKKPRTNRSRAGMVKKTKASLDQPIAAEPSRVGKRGTVVIPAAPRRRYGIEEGTLVLAEPHDGGVLIRPAVVLPVEVYTADARLSSSYPTPSTLPTTPARWPRFKPWASTRTPSHTTSPPGCKDLPILLAAIDGGATHLLTGDWGALRALLPSADRRCFLIPTPCRISATGSRLTHTARIRCVVCGGCVVCRILYPQGRGRARPHPRPRRPCGCKGGGRSRFAVGRLRRRLWRLNGPTPGLWMPPGGVFRPDGAVLAADVSTWRCGRPGSRPRESPPRLSRAVAHGSGCDIMGTQTVALRPPL